MELEIKREPSTSYGTFGKLYGDGVFFCYTLEDEIREIEGKPVREWKLAGDTAIPKGRYKVIINHSPRFKRDLPLLLDVPGFTGIRIHAGNTEDDTLGCILVGTERNERGLLRSRDALSEVIADIDEALDNGEEVWITVA